jgi:hypothetical protein
MAMRQGPLDLHHLIRRQQLIAAQYRTQQLNPIHWPLGKVCQRPVFCFTAFAITLPQQDRRRRVPIRDNCYVHGAMELSRVASRQEKSSKYMTAF